MTRGTREAMRAAVDQARRARLEIEDRYTARCRGCGCWMNDWALGCTTCNDRHIRWNREKRHPDPRYFRARYTEVRAWSETAAMRRKAYYRAPDPGATIAA